MRPLNLPDDLVQFLMSNKKLKYKRTDCECGQVSFLSLDQLKTELFLVRPEHDDDPHVEDRFSSNGAYGVRGVSLLAACESYDPHGVMVWLPQERQFGYFDEEHTRLELFSPDIPWNEISQDFPRFVNAAWGGYPNGDDAESTEPIKPWKDHPYIKQASCGALPDISEWYRVNWERGGEWDGERQLRFAEEISVSIQRDGHECSLTCEWQKPEEQAKSEVVVTRPMSIDEWNSLAERLQSGFWNASDLKAPDGIEISWCLSGFKDHHYHRIFRFYSTIPGTADPTQTLGQQIMALVGLEQRLLS